MAIKGSLKEASLADVCQLLALGLKSGCLSITDRSHFGQIFFEKGRITFAQIVNRRDRIGDLIVRDGAITAEQLDTVLVQQAREPDKRLGELLVEHGLISREVLTRYVRRQIEEAVYHLFTWTRGSFFFESGAVPSTADILVSINPESLLLEGARRVDEWSLIEKRIPSLDLMFEVEHDRLAQSDVDLSPEQQQVVPLSDGTRTVQEIIDETGLTEFDVGKALFGLIHAGFAHRVGQRESAPADRAHGGELEERRTLGLAFYHAGIYEDAAREYHRVLELDARDLEARFRLGLIAIVSGEYRSAVRHFKAVLEEGGPRYSAFVNLALALCLSGRAEDALLVLNEAESQRPGTPHVALIRAVTELLLRRVDAAAASFSEYRRRLGSDAVPPAHYYHYATLCHALRRDHESARSLAEEGCEHYSTSAVLLMTCGLVHERRGDVDAADRWYRRAAEEDGALPQVHKNLGDLAYRRGAHDDALQHYRRATELDPAIGDDTFARLGNLSYKTEQVDDAVRFWQRALELNPDNRVVRNNLKVVAGVTG